ncbi:MAG: hypothetical protein AAFX79_02855 [Planctomycetota bacterium]
MNASFAEKSVWIQAAAVGLVLGAYFAIAGIMLAHGVTALPAYAPVFAIAVALLVVVLIAGHVVAVATGRPEKADERDRLVGWRAEANSGWLLGVGVLAGITLMVLGVEAVWTAHLLLASLFLSELLRFGLQILYYRRGL